MQQYIYGPIEPFQEIRLLELYAGGNDEPLEGEIIVQTLAKAKLFCTLSYAWGSDEKPYQLETPDGYIFLTESLQQVLLALRDPERRILIWADAICIDQDDLAEKGPQISIMRDIYAQSSETVVYLGDSSPCIDLAFEAVQFMYNRHYPEAARPVTKVRRKRLLPSEDVLEDSMWVVTAEETILRPDVESGIKDLCAKEWFSRRWVVQEIVVSQEGSPIYVHCGSHCIEWTVLVVGFATILSECVPHSLYEVIDKYDEIAPDMRKKRSDFLQCYQVIGSINTLQSEYRAGQMQGICTLLKKLNKMECERKHDLILSLFGISSIRDILKLDWSTVYTHGVDALCLAVALAVIEVEGLENLLSIARYSSTNPSRLSWIPNIDPAFVPTTVFCDRYSCDIYRDAPVVQTQSTHHEIEDSNGPNFCFLPVGVYIIDVVKSAMHFSFNVPREEFNFDEVSQFITGVSMLLEDTVLVQSCPLQGREEVLAHLCAIVLVAGWCWSNVWSPSREDAMREIRDGYVHFSSLCLGIYLRDIGHVHPGLEPAEMVSTDPESLTVGLEFMANLSRVENMGLGAICLTERGFACNMPRTTAEGDLLVIIPGVGVPVVLQKCERMVGSYRYLGPAFIAGLMKGEALSLEGIEKHEITIH